VPTHVEFRSIHGHCPLLENGVDFRAVPADTNFGHLWGMTNMNDRLTVIAVIIGVLAVVPLITGGWGLSFAARESLRRNTTRGFFVNVGAKLRGGLLGVLATLPLILLCYTCVCLIISARLLLGVNPGVTFRHVKRLLIGAILTPIIVGCVLAFLIIPLMDVAWGPGTLEAIGLGGLYRFLSNWWLPSVLSIPLGSIIGLSSTDARRSDVLDPAGLAGDSQRDLPEDEASRSASKSKWPASKPVGCLAIGFGVSATFLWTVIATLDSTRKPGAGVDLHIAVLVGLIGTAIGACFGLLIDRFRR